MAPPSTVPGLWPNTVTAKLKRAYAVIRAIRRDRGQAMPFEIERKFLFGSDLCRDHRGDLVLSKTRHDSKINILSKYLVSMSPSASTQVIKLNKALSY